MEQEAWFVVQVEGDAPASRAPLAEVLEANRDDAEIVDWLKRAKVGALYVVAGDSAPVVSIQRVT